MSETPDTNKNDFSQLEESQDFALSCAPLIVEIVLRRKFGDELFDQYEEVDFAPGGGEEALLAIVEERSGTDILFPQMSAIAHAIETKNTVDEMLKYARELGVEISEDDVEKIKEDARKYIKDKTNWNNKNSK